MPEKGYLYHHPFYIINKLISEKKAPIGAIISVSLQLLACVLKHNTVLTSMPAEKIFE